MNSSKRQHICDGIGLMLIGLFSLGYVMFYKFFAEKHIQFPFLDFPIFVGEMLLFVCLLLFIAKYWKNLPKFTKWHYVIMGFFAFGVCKALAGYIEWGPLALRHSALFYYPVFAVFSYAFYRRKFLSSIVILFLALLIISIFAYGEYSSSYLLTLMCLGVILIKSYPHYWVKILLLLILFVFVPYQEFFHTSRMTLVSNLVTGIYLMSMLPLILKGKKKFKFAIVAFVGVVILLGLFEFSDHKAVKSIVNIKQLAKAFNVDDRLVRINVNNLEMKQLEVKLYNPELKVRPPTKAKGLIDKKVQQIVSNGQMNEEVQQIVSNGQMSEEVRTIVIEQTKKEISKFFAKEQINEKARAHVIKQTTKEMGKIYTQLHQVGKDKAFVKQIQEGGVIKEILKRKIIENMMEVTANKEKLAAMLSVQRENYYGNAVFRILIWRDMIVEFVKERPVMGFDFGKPLRSRSLELLLMGQGDWLRDGWIGAHNSHLHIIYRAGIIGVMFIIGYLAILFRMIKKFAALKSLTGFLLCGIIINWFVAANFLLTFELPYTAIPIWTLFGLTYAYCYKDEA